MALLLRQKLAVILLLIYWPVLFFFAHIPIPPVVRQMSVSDKSLHFIAYMVLAFLLHGAISKYDKVSWRKAAVWLVLLVISVYGATDELLQSYSADRTCSAFDFCANLAGALTGLGVLTVFNFLPGFVAIAAAAIFLLTNVAQGNLADLLPGTNAAFHLLMYLFFTVLWILYSASRDAQYAKRGRRWPTLHSYGDGGWIITALAGPIGLLLVVKLGSLIAGRNIAARDTLVSVAAIISVVGIVFVSGFFRQRLSKMS